MSQPEIDRMVEAGEIWCHWCNDVAQKSCLVFPHPGMYPELYKEEDNKQDA